ncbi:hypothetical protein [Caminibacter pacificus]
MVELRKLYEEITKDRGKPIDHWEIAALLEVYGLRDIDAKEYGFEDIFSMAEYMEKFVNEKEYEEFNEVDKNPPTLKRVVVNYFRGLAFAMPMFLQVFFTLVLGYGIWSGLNLDKMDATLIALGTFLALLITGGFIQAIGRKGLFYLKQLEHTLAVKITWRLIFISVISVLLFSLFLLIANMFFGFLQWRDFWYFYLFYLLLSLFFIAISVFQIFEEYFTIFFVFLFGMILVYIFYKLIGYGLIKSQIYSLVVLNVFTYVFAFFKLYKLKKDSLSEGNKLSRPSIIFFTVVTFFVYGFFYFLFLISDRLIAWSVDSEYKPMALWFNVRYEVGVDWALITLILLIGVAEVSIYEFLYRINDAVKKIKFINYKKLNKMLMAFYIKFNIFYLLFAFVAILIVYFGIYLLYKFTHFPILIDFFLGYTPFVFWIASISYVFLVHALINVLFIFSFSREVIVTRGIVIATIADVIIGMILSRAFGAEFAVFGLLIGSLIFWVYAFGYALKMFKNLDYYYYSAM